MTPAPKATFEIQNNSNFTIINFFGFIDASTVIKVKPVLLENIPIGTRNLIINLRKVDFLDSHGVGLFVSFLKQVHKNEGRLLFVGAEGQPASVLQMVGLNHNLVTYCETINDAQALL